jgi:nitrous oxidase accessory protein NosD
MIYVTNEASLSLDQCVLEYSHGEFIRVDNAYSSLSLTNCTINQNHSSSDDRAIYMYPGESLVVTGCNISNIDSGVIYASASTDVTIHDNDIANNTAYTAIAVFGLAATTVTQNVLTNVSSGIYTATHGGTVVNNNFLDGDHVTSSIGLQVGGTSIQSVSGNTVQEFTWGVQQSSSEVWDLVSNTIRENTYPVHLGGNDLNFSGNTFTDNTFAAVVVYGNLVADNTVWDGVPGQDWAYLIESSVTVPAGKTLTIPAGTVVKFSRWNGGHASLYVDGQLAAQGAAGAPVVFTSDRDDEYGGNTNGDGPSSGYYGDWASIQFREPNAYSLQHVVIRYGGYNYDKMIYVTNEASLSLDQCVLEYSHGEFIRVDNAYSSLSLTNCTINQNHSSSDDPAVYVNPADTLHIAGSTITNIPSNYGVRIYGSTEAQLLNNTFDSCVDGAILVANPAVVDVHDSNLLVSNEYGVYSYSSIPVNATGNYWGHPSGPGPVGPGEGSLVTANVDYGGWAIEEIPVETQDGPTITSTANTLAVVGQAYEYDADGCASASGTGSITWSKVLGPDGLSIDAQSGCISWIPSEAGYQVVSIKATDDLGVAFQVFQVYVAEDAPNDPPTVTDFSFTATDKPPDYWDAVLTVQFSEDVDVSQSDVTVLDDLAQTVPLAGFSYSPSQHTLTLQLDDLLYGVDYTLILLSTITDLSGNPLDGDGNGVGGDSYQTQFAHQYNPDPGDLDGDGVVDIDDLVILSDCLIGPAGGIPAGCDDADLNQDGNVDLLDFAEFQRLFEGSAP